MPEPSGGDHADAQVSPQIHISDTRQGAAQRRSANRSLLTIHHLDVGYGEVQVLWDVSLEIFEGEIVALVGAKSAMVPWQSARWQRSGRMARMLDRGDRFT